MSERSESINGEVMSAFKDRYEIAMSYCFRDTRLTDLIKSFPTNYLSRSTKALDEEVRAKADCRSATIASQSKIAEIRSVDDICDVLAALPTEAMAESSSQEVYTNYDAIHGATRNAKFNEFGEGTDWF